MNEITGTKPTGEISPELLQAKSAVTETMSLFRRSIIATGVTPEQVRMFRRDLKRVRRRFARWEIRSAKKRADLLLWLMRDMGIDTGDDGEATHE